jgi:hypothetical protein
LVSVIGAFLTLPDEFSQAIAHMIQAGHGHERIDFWPDATTLKKLGLKSHEIWKDKPQTARIHLRNT